MSWDFLLYIWQCIMVINRLHLALSLKTADFIRFFNLIDQPFVVDLMLRNRADVNLKIKTGFSPLFLAASKGNWNDFKYFI